MPRSNLGTEIFGGGCVYWSCFVMLSLLMAARGGVGAARAVGRRAAPDALVAARAMPVQPVRTIRAPMSVAGRAAPFAVLLVIAMFMNPV